jgi:hypothetical membrane protein
MTAAGSPPNPAAAAAAAAAAPSTTPPTPATVRGESEAIVFAVSAGGLGALYGLLIGLLAEGLPMSGDVSFGTFAAAGSGVIAALAAGWGYWRSRHAPGQEWRRALAPWAFTVNTISVVIAHTVLAVLATLVAYLVLSRGFIGLGVITFWSVVLMAVTLGLTAYLVSLSVSRMTTQRMSSLLMAFIVIGTLTAMVTTPDPVWWQIHFSHLGTFWALSSAVFNGTLVAGGLLVTTFAVYIAADMRALVARRRLAYERSPKIVSALFVVMGIMLAGVGLVPVNVNEPIHNLSASGMALVFVGMLAAGPKILRGMPTFYFLSTWAFLASTVLTVALFATGYFGLTALEIIVFALIFGWIAVFIRFLGVTGQTA